MTLRSTSILLALVSVFVTTQSAESQAQNAAQDLQRVRQQFSQPVQAMPGQTQYPVANPGVPSQHYPPQATYPVQPYPVQPYPRQYPVYVSPDQFDGYNPYTGGINTRNEQINNTYYDPNREASKHNGTRRWVKRPVHNAQGQVVGYQEGWVWTNSVTGVEHGELRNKTGNNQGGEHNQIIMQSVPNP